jgi:ABC-type phosphate transport system substrate-binding protein
MSRTRRHFTRFLFLAGFLLSHTHVPLHARQAPFRDIAVVTHSNVPVDNLTFVELRKVVLGDKQYWETNLRVTLLLRAPVARERDIVLQKVYEMTESQFRQYWIGKVFRAEVAAGPKIVNSTDASIGLLSSVPGSIAFIDSAQVPKNFKILRIDGKLPGQDGYPLR